MAPVVVMMAVASATVGSVFTATINYARNTRKLAVQEKAAFLADAGLRAALVKLNNGAGGTISLNQSRTYFSETNVFANMTWGFETRAFETNGQVMVASMGVYGQRRTDVSARVALSSGSRSIHALFAHALYAGNTEGNTNYTLKIGGTGSAADFIHGDTYSGNRIELTGDSSLRLPELLYDTDSDGVYDGASELWDESHAVQVFSNPLTQVEFDAFEASVPSSGTYANGRYDFGEAFVDTIGNGRYDEGELFVDLDGNGIRDSGDEFTDLNDNGVRDPGEPFQDYGNGSYDDGEEWTEDSDHGHHGKRINGRYDPPGGFWKWKRSQSRWIWKTDYRKGGTRYYCTDWPGEDFEDAGDGVYYGGEPYTDQNGVYDPGEEYLDDRNGRYDYGTQAIGDITGMPTPGPGQRAATGGDAPIAPPDLAHMYYEVNHGGLEPLDGLPRWGNDVAVTAADYGSAIAINDDSFPEHIFLRNPPNSGSSYVWNNGAKIYKRTYTPIYNDAGGRVDDYFLEDPTDSTFNSNPSDNRIAQNDSSRTCTMLIDVKSQDNAKLYYVDGNVYIHSPRAYSMRFREPGTRITIVASGNITISDEFYYNANYPANLQYADMDSTVVQDPSDALCLIALKNPNCAENSGNIYIGDRQFGTGGSIHAILYAENDFVDNNLGTVNQQFISVFGSMSAGNEVRINRQEGSGSYRTRLDVTLDARIRDGEIEIPGLPHSLGSQRSIDVDSAWDMVPGTWFSWSPLG